MHKEFYISVKKDDDKELIHITMSISYPISWKRCMFARWYCFI